MFVRTGLLFFSAEILTIFLRKREDNGKLDQFLGTLGGDRATVQFYDLLGNGKPQSRAAVIVMFVSG